MFNGISNTTKMRAQRGSTSKSSSGSNRHHRTEQDIANERMEQWLRENEEYNLCARVLSMFYAPTKYRVVKIARSSSEVVWQTMKHTVIYPGSGPSSEAIALHPVV
jgi:hypothetical protein